MLGLLLFAEAIIVVVAVISKDWIETELRTKFDDMVCLTFLKNVFYFCDLFFVTI